MFHTYRIQAYKRSGESFRPRRVTLLRDYIAYLKARVPLDPDNCPTQAAAAVFLETNAAKSPQSD